MRFVPSRQSDSNLILVASSFICFTLQYTSIYLTHLSSFSALTSPSYIGKTNFTSSLSNGISGLCLLECFLEEVVFKLVFVLEEEDGDDRGEGGGLGGSSPSSLLSFFEYSP
jgi:hypothetical protein